MPLFIIENQELSKNKYSIPKGLEDHLKTTLQQYKDYGTTSAGTVSKGFKRLQGLVNPNFNKQGENLTADGHRTVSYSDMKRIDHDFRHMSQNPKDMQRILNGGDPMATWVKNTLSRERTKVEPVLKQKKVETRNKNKVKPSLKPMKPIEVGNVSANVHESVLKEGLEDHPYWDMLSDYDAYYIFDCFSHNKDLWRPLIQPEMYQQALREFTKYGKFIKFPTKYVYQWMGIIMKNTAILRACTEICGHANSVPVDEFIEFFFGGDGAMFEEYKESHNFDSDYDAMWEFLYEKGWDNYSKLPDGSDAISDYGIRPLEQIISEYNSDLEPEKVIVLINRLLDVVHCRGDLASMFIVGGSKTLSAISEEKKTKKTIFITENQLNKLLEYRDDLELPFHDLGPMSTPYAKPNYRHFLDWLENMGKYGSLPSSTSNIDDLIGQYEPSSFDLWVDRTYDLDPDIINEWAKDWLDINQPYLNELSVLSPNEIATYLDKGYTDDIVLHQLNDIGEESWANFLRERFYDELDVYRFPHDLSVNERGLIYVERAIQMPKLTSYTYSTYVRGKQSDLYKHLTNEYGNGVGRYWSWQPNGSAIYNSSEYGGTDKPVCIILKGWVDPTSVDWVETLIVNAYSLKEEKEINIRGGQPVELFEIEFPNKKLQLKQPLIIYT